jgi:glycosyltransferase involved in cell wall biosynthesis
VEQLRQQEGHDIEVITTLPNRYSSYTSEASEFERDGNLAVNRIALPPHKSGMVDQSKAFYYYQKQAKVLIAGKSYDMVFATSSRLFTALLGASVASRLKVPLYLDVRDIFVDTMKDVLSKPLSLLAKPVLTAIENYTFRKAETINLVSEGFRNYFEARYPDVRYRWYTNGIDEVFERESQIGCDRNTDNSDRITVLYAGNIGEGQGLHTIVPQLASKLGGDYHIKIIGDGGRKPALEESLASLNLGNVSLLPPVDRAKLIEEYKNADILFLHLNDYPAFDKVLPSKIFEYAAMGKPVLAGVNGYSAQFLKNEVENSAVFYPGNAGQALEAVASLDLQAQQRSEFVEKFRREKIMKDMAVDIVDTVKRSASPC